MSHVGCACRGGGPYLQHTQALLLAMRQLQQFAQVLCLHLHRSRRDVLCILSL